MGVGANSLSGTIPQAYQALSQLQGFALGQNELSGTVPLTLCKVNQCGLEGNTFECPKDEQAFHQCATRCKGTCEPPATEMNAEQPQSIGHSDGTNGGTVAVWAILVMACVGLILAGTWYWRGQPGDVVEAQQLKPMSAGSSYSACPQAEEIA
eukprot:TRINITY_DN3733_c0_g1_i1.p1 TRINITY_DN3733_c0_g1~~TRINITY_DN3733_c0_g1_i1.p1  ORF type:complete len:153 (-),score=33.98 TRINITY_DN3733_c0_g1_i1:89-547(-)